MGPNSSARVSLVAAVVSVLGAVAALAPYTYRVVRERGRVIESAPGATRVLCVGDSLTSNGYPEHLQAALGPGFAVVNGGVSGDFTRDMLSRWRAGLRAGGFDVVVVLGGVNDLRGGVPDAAVPTANLRALYAEAESGGARVVRVTVPPFKGSGWTEAREVARRAVNEAVCVGYCADAARALDDGASRLRPQYDRGDHLHLSQEGMRALAAVVAETVHRLQDDRLLAHERSSRSE